MLELIANQAANGKQTPDFGSLVATLCGHYSPDPNYITDRRSRDRNAAAQTRKYVASFGVGLNSMRPTRPTRPIWPILDPERRADFPAPPGIYVQLWGRCRGVAGRGQGWGVAINCRS